jgi:branched-chain amino acid transport system ATP-binding protein
LHPLEIRRLSAGYGKAWVLAGVNITFSEGINSIIGPNGAGKSTLFRCLSRLISYQGEISFLGVSLSNLNPDKIVKMGIVQCPEGRLLFPEMSVFENLEMGSYLIKDSNQVQASLEDVFTLFPVLKKRVKQLAGTLSGGEQQMLAIGRSMMSKPKLLLLDEPSFGLSPIVKENVAEGIKEIANKGIWILLNEQDTSVAMNVAETFFIIDTGQIVFEGSRESLMQNDILMETYLGAV